MRSIFKHAAVAISTALFLSTQASATTFNYSEDFGPDAFVSGSFEGTLSNGVVTNIQNASVLWNGDTVISEESSRAYAYSPGHEVLNSGTASFDGMNNDFIFSNADDSVELFSLASYGSTFRDDEDVSEPYLSGALPGSGWTLAVAVPECSSQTLMLAGLAVVGLLSARRKSTSR